jgi:hypothetical protein
MSANTKKIKLSFFMVPLILILLFLGGLIDKVTLLPIADPENLTEVTSVCTEVDFYRWGSGKGSNVSYYTFRLKNGGYYQARTKKFQADKETLEQCVGREITLFLYRDTLVGVEDAERVYLSVEDSLEWYTGGVRGYAIAIGVIVLIWGGVSAYLFLPLQRQGKSFSRISKEKNRALRAEGKNGPPVAASRKKQKNRKKQAQSKRQEEPKPPSGEESE